MKPITATLPRTAASNKRLLHPQLAVPRPTSGQTQNVGPALRSPYIGSERPPLTSHFDRQPPRAIKGESTLAEWCDNRLRIIGEVSELERFRREMADRKRHVCLSAENIRPTPGDLGTVADYLATPEARAVSACVEELAGTERDRFIAANPALYMAPLATDATRLWREQNWGTAHEFSSPRLVERKPTLVFRFLTTWSEPGALVAHLARQNPKLVFEHVYALCYAGSAGRSVYCLGQVASQVELANDSEACAKLMESVGFTEAASAFEELAELAREVEAELALPVAKPGCSRLRLAAVNGRILTDGCGASPTQQGEP